MNIKDFGSPRPKLHLPKFLSADAREQRGLTLSSIELRRIVAELLG